MISADPRCAVFVSGRGSNLQVLLDMGPQFNVSLVVSSSKNALALQRAENSGVPTHLLNYPNPNWSELEQVMTDLSIDGVFLAGFMKILPKDFVNHWRGRIFNIHPSLLPQFKGLHGVRRAYESKASVGATIHRVVEDVDAGEILKQQVSVSEDQLDSFSFAQVEQKNLQTEHRLLAEWVEEQWPSVLM